jgi:hypothetical protein
MVVRGERLIVAFVTTGGRDTVWSDDINTSLRKVSIKFTRRVMEIQRKEAVGHCERRIPSLTS